MDVYKFPEHGNADAYLIQGTADTNSQSTNPLLQPLETMYTESAPEYVLDQGMYYPSGANYGYICTGLDSPGDWDDQNVQFVGTQTDQMPYVYYTPGYGYAQSPYNPYNPYIPGAMISTDGSFVGPQQYYIPTYDNGTNSPAYYPMIVQPGSETYTTDQFMDMNSSTANVNTNSNSSLSPATFSLNSSSNHAQNIGSEGVKSNGGLNKLNATNGGVSVPASPQILQGQGGQTIDNLSNGKTASNHNHSKPTLPSGNFGLNGNGRAVVDKTRSDLGEGNNGPRINTTNARMTVKAYSTKAGNSDAQGNITICVDQYNKDDFPVEYVNAKFFVIKSYSEDDVHKSIKYNVWSSTPNGNRKLNNAYDEAQKMDPNRCPVFLFFSVNASGQFCGVAEMTGRVDFHKDMDFWQQDKWSGSFPVKWHIIKDVPNPHFRHIIVENNEHKPVTNSRDTQEIKYKKGLEMLKVFKNYKSKTSLLDDFMYYENRQKILQEEKARLLINNYGTPVFVPVLHPPRKLNNFLGLGSSEDVKSSKENDINTSQSNNNVASVTNNDAKVTEIDAVRFGSLDINSERMESSGSGNVLTVGSMPVKVNGFGESSGFLTVGTIPLDPKAFEVKEGGVSIKKG